MDVDWESFCFYFKSVSFIEIMDIIVEWDVVLMEKSIVLVEKMVVYVEWDVVIL